MTVRSETLSRDGIVGVVVLVEFGRSGSQFALITRNERNSGYGLLTVRKYRANSRRWTKPIKICQSSVLRVATEDEVDRLPFAVDVGVQAMQHKLRLGGGV